MANPWLKKNPFMSVWLTGANAAAGSLRGHATAAAKRQATSAMTQATKTFVEAWSFGLAPPVKPRKRRRR
ncbi:MAG TPA: hypothetical protein VN680_14055 [Burkholderiaceae bacterium]|jgi:hypothetical protein|nr:hypothetical protein [Burkholderiaceae bacterium]